MVFALFCFSSSHRSLWVVAQAADGEATISSFAMFANFLRVCSVSLMKMLIVTGSIIDCLATYSLPAGLCMLIPIPCSSAVWNLIKIIENSLTVTLPTPSALTNAFCQDLCVSDLFKCSLTWSSSPQESHPCSRLFHWSQVPRILKVSILSSKSEGRRVWGNKFSISSVSCSPTPVRGGPCFL